MDSLDWIVVLSLFTAVILWCLRENRKDKKQRAIELAMAENRREREWEKGVKRWREINALRKEWETTEGHEAIGFEKWVQKKGVTQYELDHIYYEWEYRELREKQ